MVVWGDFTSGAGRYILIPIQSITGRFHNQGRHLSFADVKVHTSISTISTNALHIDNGELTLGPLNITSNGGSNFAIYDEDTFDKLGNTMNRIKNDMTQAGQNMKTCYRQYEIDTSGRIKAPQVIQNTSWMMQRNRLMACQTL